MRVIAKKKTYPSRYPVRVNFSRAVVVGDLLFVSGCSGQTLETFHVSSHDVCEQTDVALDKIRGALEEAGASMNDVAKVTVYLTRGEDWPRVGRRIEEYYRVYAPDLIREPPAQTIVVVPGLHEPDLLVEIDCTAAMPHGASSFRQPLGS